MLWHPMLESDKALYDDDVNGMWYLYYVLLCTVSVSLCMIMIAWFYMNGLA